MRRLLAVVLLCVGVLSFGEEGVAVKQFTKILTEAGYKAVPGGMKVGNKTFLIYVHYLKEDEKIVDQALVFETSANTITVHLIIDSKGAFTNGTGVVICDFTMRKDYYGAALSVGYGENNYVGLSISTYFSFGDKRFEADPFGIEWNAKENKFQRHVVVYQ